MDGVSETEILLIFGHTICIVCIHIHRALLFCHGIVVSLDTFPVHCNESLLMKFQEPRFDTCVSAA